MRIRLKNIISLCVSYLLLVVAMFIVSIDEASGGAQVTGSLILLIVFAFTLVVLYLPFIITSIFERKGTSIAVLSFSAFMEIAVMLPMLLNAIFNQHNMSYGRIVTFVFIPIDMLVLLFVIITNAIFISRQNRMLR